ncbi:hypothetical protein LSTR_LSTR012193 [Laodelphax striatellus]|uniref:BUB1 N-terminal domain-containing protein n=1 Tax=Laodelphax striatellus TaxID=195883 RepID=A0A482WMJ2_LAOST|nr:hypothetical protein LSTR_LSTR012193 [Laodelphax striatellus]
MDVLELKEREFAQQLKQCTGSEELDVILNYINWLEVNCPQKAQDDEVITVLSNTLTKFNESQYTNDIRYIELLVKYMQSQENALELYQLAFSQGKGVECAVLYCAWAHHLARMKNLTEANHVFQLGCERNAKPAQQLQLAYLLFQVNIGRRCLGMSELEAFGSDVINAFETLLPQRVPQPTSQQHASHRDEVQNWRVAEFDLPHPTVVCCYPKKEIYSVENNEFQYEEILATRHEKKLKNPPAKDQNGASKTNDKELQRVVAIFEPENPKFVKCYPFKEVYAIENNEFQLEEVYAARYEKKLQEIIKQREKEKRKSRASLHPNELADLTKNSFLIQEDEQKEAVCLENENDELPKPSNLDQPGSDLPSNEWDRNAESTSHPMGSATRQMNQSVTREVMNMVQDMWKSPSPVAAKHQPSSAAPAIRKQNSVHPATKTPFKLYTDEMDVDGTPAQSNKENPFGTVRKSVLQPTTKTPFKLYTDQMEVDGTPALKPKPDESQQPGKLAFSSSRFQMNQFVANDWTKKQQMNENPKSMASAVGPSCENSSASNMN